MIIQIYLINKIVLHQINSSWILHFVLLVSNRINGEFSSALQPEFLFLKESTLSFSHSRETLTIENYFIYVTISLENVSSYQNVRLHFERFMLIVRKNKLKDRQSPPRLHAYVRRCGDWFQFSERDTSVE